VRLFRPFWVPVGTRGWRFGSRDSKYPGINIPITVIGGDHRYHRYHRRFDCRLGITRWRRWFGLLLLFVTNADINWLSYFNLLTICSLFFSPSNSSPFFVWHFSGHLFSDPFLHVLLSAHHLCWAAVSGTTSPAADSFVVCSALTCDELTAWRDMNVTSWPVTS